VQYQDQHISPRLVERHEDTKNDRDLEHAYLGQIRIPKFQKIGSIYFIVVLSMMEFLLWTYTIAAS